MVSGMGTSVESDVFMASSELEAQHKSTDIYTKQLATDVSRMKVNIPLVIFVRMTVGFLFGLHFGYPTLGVLFSSLAL